MEVGEVLPAMMLFTQVTVPAGPDGELDLTSTALPELFPVTMLSLKVTAPAGPEAALEPALIPLAMAPLLFAMVFPRLVMAPEPVDPVE